VELQDAEVSFILLFQELIWLGQTINRKNRVPVKYANIINTLAYGSQGDLEDTYFAFCRA